MIINGAERIRSFVAAVIFKRADELMHRGSIIQKTNILKQARMWVIPILYRC